jgi:hypothetical protein
LRGDLAVDVLFGAGAVVVRVASKSSAVASTGERARRRAVSTNTR